MRGSKAEYAFMTVSRASGQAMVRSLSMGSGALPVPDLKAVKARASWGLQRIVAV